MRNKKFLLLDIIIWVLLLIGLVFFGLNITKTFYGNSKSYQVSFKDIDSLSIGSPVRVMGIQVGHVSKIRLLDDRVLVDFVVKDNQLSIPNGSQISIQFTGMAGSKSLDIEPANNSITNNNLSLKVIEPIRIQSVMELQSKMSESILSYSKSLLDMLGKSNVENIKSDIKSSNKKAGETIQAINISKDQLQSTKNNIIDSTNNIKTYLNDQNKNISPMTKFIDTKSVDEWIKSFTRLEKNYTIQTETNSQDK